MSKEKGDTRHKGCLEQKTKYFKRRCFPLGTDTCLSVLVTLTFETRVVPRTSDSTRPPTGPTQRLNSLETPTQETEDDPTSLLTLETVRDQYLTLTYLRRVETGPTPPGPIGTGLATDPCSRHQSRREYVNRCVGGLVRTRTGSLASKTETSSTERSRLVILQPCPRPETSGATLDPSTDG